MFTSEKITSPQNSKCRKVAVIVCLSCSLIYMPAVGVMAQIAAQRPDQSVRARYEERERELMREIEKRPTDAKLYNELGVNQFYLGKGAAAEESFLKAIQLDPRSADARANLSFHYYQVGKQEASADLLRESLTIDPNNFLANYYSGLLYFARKQPTRAEIFLKKALALQPSSLDVQLDLIKVQAANGDVAGAELGLDRLATERPSEARIRYARAAFYASQARSLDALSEYKTVLAIAPESTGVLLEMAIIYFRERQYYDAIKLLTEFHKTGASVESSYLMGHALAETGQLDLAETWLRRSLAGKEDYFDARLQLGRLLFTRRNYVDAIEQLRRAVSLQETGIEARYILGFCLELTNDLDAAMVQYDEILRIAPERFEGYHGAGSVLFKRGDTQKALANLSRAAQLNPRDADVRYLMGRALARAGNNSGAIDHLQAAVALAPGRVDVRFQLATALRKAGRDQEADEQFKIVEQLNTEFRTRQKNP